MTIVFLDFDGVLNNSSSDFVRTLNAEEDEGFMSIAAPDPICVRLVDHLVDKTGAVIVVSSSWRQGMTVEELRVCLRDEFGLKNWDKVVAKTRPNDRGDVRGNQIDDYVREHKIKTYVILDDDSDMLDKQKKHFVQTSYETGFRVTHLEQALEILGEPKEGLR